MWDVICIWADNTIFESHIAFSETIVISEKYNPVKDLIKSMWYALAEMKNIMSLLSKDVVYPGPNAWASRALPICPKTCACTQNLVSSQRLIRTFLLGRLYSTTVASESQLEWLCHSHILKIMRTHFIVVQKFPFRGVNYKGQSHGQEKVVKSISLISLETPIFTVNPYKAAVTHLKQALALPGTKKYFGSCCSSSWTADGGRDEKIGRAQYMSHIANRYFERKTNL